MPEVKHEIVKNYGFIPSGDFDNLGKESLSDVSPVVGDGVGSRALLWKYIEGVIGEDLTPRNQGSTSSCVGQATASAVDMLQGVQIAGLGTLTVPYVRADATSIYAMARYEIGKLRHGRRLSGGGTYVRYAAEAVQSLGCLSMKKYDIEGARLHDLTQFSVNRCRDWEKKGLPNYLEPIALNHLTKETTAINSYEECRAALANGWPVVIGSKFGFKGQKRDVDGFLKVRGSWSHAMLFIGYDETVDRPSVTIANSWGTRWVGGPRPNIPAGCFNIELDVCDDMCKRGEAIALSGFGGFGDRTPLDFDLLG